MHVRDLNELPREVTAFIDFQRVILEFAVSVDRDARIGWVVALAGMAGFAVLPRRGRRTA
ncbi:MAG: hypothetical protein OXH76_18530 [Boseongicola sp.]|nr:hypothetical protein [Boseongicola sp.]